MNSITSNRNSMILLLTALLAASLFALYYFLITPKLEEVEAKKDTLSSLNQQITNMQEQITVLDETLQTSISNELSLRNKVPQSKEINKILLKIAEIEAVTGTLVDSIRFTNYDTTVANSTLQDPSAPVVNSEGTEETTGLDELTTTDQPPSDTPAVSTIARDSLPAQLKLLTFSFEIAAINQQDLLTFIKEIEQIERVMKFETVSLTSPGEIELLQEDAEPTYKASIQITTFYYEDEN